jgi:predicted MPP superfamily phosphohydrolase
MLLVVAVLFFIDWYFFQGFKTTLKSYSANAQKISSYVYWGLSLSIITFIFIVFVTGTPQPKGTTVSNWIFVFTVMLYISKILVLPFLLIDDISRLFQWVFAFFQTKTTEGNAPDSVGIDRSQFFSKLAVYGAAVPVVGFTTGIAFGAHNYQVRKQKLVLPKLPKSFEGLKIVQISDIHAGSFWNKSGVERGIQKIMELKPDVIFFTGDLVNNTADEFNDWSAVFGKLKAPMGIYSILGNHDYGDYKQWPSPEAKAKNLADLRAHHYALGWNLLDDTHKLLEKNGDNIAIIGIQNWGTGRFPKSGNLAKALNGLPNEIPIKLLLSHDPSHWDAQVRPDFPQIDVQFSGHTHGMQFGVDNKVLKWSPVQYRYKQWGGLYQEGHQQLYVNRGFGFIGYPGRLGIWPEITLLELARA